MRPQRENVDALRSQSDQLNARNVALHPAATTANKLDVTTRTALRNTWWLMVCMMWLPLFLIEPVPHRLAKRLPQDFFGGAKIARAISLNFED